MVPLTGRRFQRYELIRAAHEFILTVLPLRHAESRQALDRFIRKAHGNELAMPESDAIFITVLSLLDPHTHGRLPSLVDRYLGARHTVPVALERFRQCVIDVIRYRGVGNPEVQRAIALIEESYCDPRFTQGGVAALLDLSAQELSSSFAGQTGVTFTEYLRDFRLDQGARLLLTREDSVKEVWSAVGYNDGSNFSHQFRHRFGMSPRDYRALAIRTAEPATPPRPVELPQGHGQSLLIVDDDLEARGKHLGGISARVDIRSP